MFNLLLSHLHCCSSHQQHSYFHFFRLVKLSQFLLLNPSSDHHTQCQSYSTGSSKLASSSFFGSHFQSSKRFVLLQYGVLDQYWACLCFWTHHWACRYWAHHWTCCWGSSMRMRTVLHWAWFPWTTTTSFNVTTIPLIAVKFFTLFLCVCWKFYCFWKFYWFLVVVADFFTRAKQVQKIEIRDEHR